MHTAEISPLEAAQTACHRASDSRGLRIYLVDVQSIERVKERLQELSWKLTDRRHQFVTMDVGGDIKHDGLGEETAARHLALLANLYAEMLASKRTGA